MTTYLSLSTPNTDEDSDSGLSQSTDEDYSEVKFPTYTPHLFSIDDFASSENCWKKTLDTDGYVVIKDILTEGEYIKGISLFERDWNAVTPYFSFEDKSTWTKDNCPMMWDSGMITWNGFGQSDFQWHLRTNDRIKNIFKKIHNTDDLVVSYDGFSVHVSPKQESHIWLHQDQNKNEPWVKGCDSIQGAYNFFPVDKSDAGFVVVPGSHIDFTPDKEIYRKRQFIMIEKDSPFIEKAVKLLIPGNCLTLWNSYTLHQNVGMTQTCENTINNRGPADYINRLTSYITYFPKSLRSDIIYRHRVSGYYLGHNCSHYATRHDVKRAPYEYYNMNGSINRDYKFNIINSTLTDVGLIPEDRMELI